MPHGYTRKPEVNPREYRMILVESNGLIRFILQWLQIFEDTKIRAKWVQNEFCDNVDYPLHP